MVHEKRLSRAIVRAPSTSLTAGLTRAKLGLPDYARAAQQHAAYCDALQACGLTLTHLEADERFPDSTFIEDTAVMIVSRDTVWDSGSSAAAQKAILTRPGAPSRMGELESVEQSLTHLGFEIYAISAPGTLDGGDVCETEDHFFIGISERTNEQGAAQLADLVKSFGYTASFVDIRGVDTILHLKSGLAYLGDNRLLLIDALASRREFQRFELVRVRSAEEYAVNCLRVNDHALVAAGFPHFDRTLEDMGYKTVALEMSEFQKLDGGLSCLSLRF